MFKDYSSMTKQLILIGRPDLTATVVLNCSIMIKLTKPGGIKNGLHQELYKTFN